MCSHHHCSDHEDAQGASIETEESNKASRSSALNQPTFEKTLAEQELTPSSQVVEPENSDRDKRTPSPSLLATGAMFMIRFYQTAISPYTPPACRYRPTCSAYTKEAIKKYGFFKGGWMGFWRILRCNPLCKGGYDPVP